MLHILTSLHFCARLIFGYLSGCAHKGASQVASAFNERRATQIACRILSLTANGKMREIRLVKFMYMVDRCAIERWGLPLTWDRLASLPHGPVQSSVLNLANQTVPTYDGTDYWRTHIRLEKHRNWRGKLIPWCVIDAEAEDETLSEEAISLIDEVYREFRDKDIVQIVEDLPEHTDPKGSSIPIRLEDLLKAVGSIDPEGDAKEIESLAYVHEVLDC